MVRSQVSLYASPSSVVLILGGVNESTLAKLNTLLKQKKLTSLKLVIVSTNFTKDLEALREYLLAIHSFTIEVYIVQETEMGEIVKEGTNNIKAIIATNPAMIERLPHHLKTIAEGV